MIHDWPNAQLAVNEFRSRLENENVSFRLTHPPMLCKPLSDGSIAPCGTAEFEEKKLLATLGIAR